MPPTDLLKQFGLSRNPFTDRTAEKSYLDPLSLYIHSDLRGFRPSETTYVFFGRRGSGKTTIRLQMETAYTRHNEAAIASGKSKGHFVVDITKPGHMTACLTTFMETIKASTDNWDAAFSDQWLTADLVDCILSYAVTELVRLVSRTDERARAMLDELRCDPKACRQFLLLSHLYARTDASTLAGVRAALLRPRYTAGQVTVGVSAGLCTLGTAVAASRQPAIASAISSQVGAVYDRVAQAVPLLDTHPKLVLGGLLASASAAGVLYARYLEGRSHDRAAALQRNVRVVRPQPTELVAGLVNSLFSSHDTVDTIRLLTIGVSAHQKMELLSGLLRLLGYDSLAVFGDCFDEVTLLDPVRFPGAIKVFAREACRNDILNFGRLHFFFPDSRLSLDLNTDKTLKEARFDRHFVRDLTWSRHQLEELAERRFHAAQEALTAEAKASGHVKEAAELEAAGNGMTFADLFKKVRGEDFSSYLSKLSTPRELMIMMTEMFGRIEAHPEGGLTAQDMEIAVTKALEQSV